jgi:hypothetical protein
MIKILKKLFNFFSFQPIEHTSSDGKKIYIVLGGEATSTIIVEGAGAINICNQKPKSLES